MLQRTVHDIGPLGLEDSGRIVANFTSLEAITEADAVYLNSSSYIGRAQANSSTTMHAIGVAFRGIASGRLGPVITHGPMRSANYNFSGFLGRLAYVSTSGAGAIRTTPPSASGEIVQVLGQMVERQLLNVSLGLTAQVGAAIF